MWDEIEPQETDRRDVKQQREDTDRLFARVFGSDDGKELLEVFRRWYVDPPVAQPGTEASWAYFREGQRHVIQDIETRLRRSLNV